MLYTVLGEAAPIADKTAFKGLVRWMTALIVFTMAAFVWAPIPYGLYFKKLSEPTSALARWAAANATWLDGSMSMPLKFAAERRSLRLFRDQGSAHSSGGTAAVRLGYPDIRTLVRTHAILFKGHSASRRAWPVAGPDAARYSLILFHVVAWYIFAAYNFAKHPPQAPQRRSPWMQPASADSDAFTSAWSWSLWPPASALDAGPGSNPLSLAWLLRAGVVSLLDDHAHHR